MIFQPWMLHCPLAPTTLTESDRGNTDNDPATKILLMQVTPDSLLRVPPLPARLTKGTSVQIPPPLPFQLTSRYSQRILMTKRDDHLPRHRLSPACPLISNSLLPILSALAHASSMSFSM